MFYHVVNKLGLLQTTAYAQEPFECPDRPKLGKLTVYHVHAINWNHYGAHDGIDSSLVTGH